MTDTIFFNFIPLLLQAVITITSLVYFDTNSALIIFLLIIVFLIFSFAVNLKQQRANMEANDAEDSEKATISDIFTNIESIKYFGKENNIKRKYQKIGEKTRDAILRNWNYYRLLSAGQTLILGIGTFLILYFPINSVLNKTMTIGTIVFIFTVYVSLLGNLFKFDQGIRGFYRSMADFESLFKYYKVQNEIKNAPNAKTLEIKTGEIRFNKISFAYNRRRIFDNLSLHIPRGRKVALIGPSGGGKSTLIKLLYRLYDLDKGEILIDGKNINEFEQESLRSELSIVPQECVLFDDTIYNNIAFSNPHAKRADVLNAIRFAQLDKIIRQFPDKDDTIVGERGVKLSGGEKQRVSIARALLADKKVLVLDEATSSLDSETEQEIKQALSKLMEGKTAIMIAHRLSTIMNADEIIVIDDGEIVQKGTHNELIKKDGLYKKLWDLQKGGYIQ